MVFFTRHFTRVEDLPDLTGKVALVTGGNANLGLYTIQHLARKGATVYMGARDEDRAKEAIDLLQSEGLGPGNGEVRWLDLDLGDPLKTRKAGEEFLKLESRLDILVHNAARPYGPSSRSHHDIEDVIMVNHICPFILTQTLRPVLSQTAAKDPNNDVRIVVISSNIHHLIKDAKFESRDDFNRQFDEMWSPALARYALSKFCNVLFTNELQRQFDEESVPIIVMAINPGGIDTDRTRTLFRDSNILIRAIYYVVIRSFHKAPTAAKTIAFIAASPEVRSKDGIYRGAYLEPPGVLSKSSKVAQDLGLAKQLWVLTEEVVKTVEV